MDEYKYDQSNKPNNEVENVVRNQWGTEEESLLKKFYNTARINQLQKLFPNRSKPSIFLKAQRLGLSGRKEYPSQIDEKGKDFAYALGAVLGDGSLVKYKTSYHIRLEVKNETFARNFYQTLIKLGCKPWFGERKQRGTFIVDASNKPLYLLLKNMKDNVTVIPKDIDKNGLLKGFFDSEGCFDLHKGKHPRIRMSNTDLVKVNFIIDLLEKLGFRPTINTHRCSFGSKTCYDICLHRYAEALKFKKLMEECLCQI